MNGRYRTQIVGGPSLLANVLDNLPADESLVSVTYGPGDSPGSLGVLLCVFERAER